MHLPPPPSTTSGHIPELRLVYRAETAANTSIAHTQGPDIWSDYQWVRGSTGNTNIAWLRDLYGADLVSYLVEYFGSPGEADPPYYYEPPGRYSAVGGFEPYVFAHEIAHNFCCHHTVQQENDNGFEIYAYGWIVTVGGLQWTTIMAARANHQCVGVLPVFSNPNLSWQGAALGSASADNHTQINNKRAAVADLNPVKVARLESASFSSSPNFHFTLTAPAGTGYAIEYATQYTVDSYGLDNTTWTTLIVEGNPTFAISGSYKNITDTNVTAITPQKYYRAKKDGLLIGSEIGFYRKTVPSGYSMIGNQLDGGDNRVSSVIPNASNGSKIFKWDSGTQTYYQTCVFDFGAWSDPNLSLGPGEGVAFFSPADQTFTFVGNVLPGFEIDLPVGWSIVSSAVPQAGLARAALAFPTLSAGPPAGQVSRMTGNNVFTTYTSNGNNFLPSEPSMNIGEGFWVYRGSYTQDDQVGGNQDNFWRRVFWVW